MFSSVNDIFTEFISVKLKRPIDNVIMKSYSINKENHSFKRKILMAKLSIMKKPIS